MTHLTPTQRRALEFIESCGTDEAGGRYVSPRTVAKHLWPDSPAWDKRTRGRRTGKVNGAMGGTMPMLAAKVLHALEAQRLVEEIGYLMEGRPSAWVITAAGRDALTEETS